MTRLVQVYTMLFRFFGFESFSNQVSSPSLSVHSESGDDSSKKPLKPFLLLFTLGLWIKLRLIYYVNNWVYTTNHKRIAVNYYWFVIFSGICGMVLATIIRLEMAYPGVGILAGDSLQYLSVVTAHAVIMVFFMIMPLLFGAFGNFLLPTQLGVHDVAFPRLNSAAFWFLPAGLLMLVQLVCLDRRYQRMNCYNIREIQTILKSKYSPNPAEDVDIRSSLNESAVSLRYNLNGPDFLDPAIFTYYKNALVSHPRYRAFHEYMHTPISEITWVKLTMSRVSSMYTVLRSMYEEPELGSSDLLIDSTSRSHSASSSIGNVINVFLPSTSSSSVSFSFSQLVSDLNPVSMLGSLSSCWTHLLSAWVFEAALMIQLFVRSWVNFIGSLLSWSVVSSLSSCASRFYTNFVGIFDVSNLPLLRELLTSSFASSSLVQSMFSSSSSIVSKEAETPFSYSTEQVSLNSLSSDASSLLGEKSSDQRFMRFMNPVFKYDFKVGNYMPDDVKKMNPHLFTSIKDVTTGIRKSSWFTSADYTQMFKANIASHVFFFGGDVLSSSSKSSLAALNSDLDSNFSANSYHSTNVTFTGGFYNYLGLLSAQSDVLSTRWLAVSAFEQKFAKMFATSSMQQRIHANWRQLKFTREAWRCKLLAARHQNTLYKRYLNEDSVVWAVERNAKDVLPGWAMITPFSARARFTAIGKVDIGLMGVFLVLNSSIVASANFLVTYRYLSTLNNRKMRDARSFFTEGVMVASWMMIAANPMLAIGILMLLSDRHWQTSFFDYSGGGDTVLFQHMFWFFGHPEVYVIMIPAFGFNNTILSFYLRKRVSARASLLYSMYTIAFLGFFVWGHHMYMVGLAHTTRMLFSTLTVMISVPAATKLMHWCVTLVNSSFVLELPMYFQLLFIFFFVSGGISGMAVAHTGMDVLFHDSFYVVGHFHVMLAGSAMFASFGAFYFYFPAIFGVKFSRIWGYLHGVYYLTGQIMTVVPMFWLGYAAMPRRVLDYPAALGGWHAIVSAGHMLSVAGMMAFFVMIFDSIRQGRAATRNSFGVARFNTRLNFYIYEGARTWFLQRKGWYLSRFNRHDSVRLNRLNFVNHEYLETTLYTYVLLKK